MKSWLQNFNFLAGMIHPAFDARPELPIYHKGAKIIHNLLCMPHGGVEKRPGMAIMRETQEPCRLFPFHLTADDGAFIELTPFKITIILFHERKVKVIKSPWGEDDLAQLNYNQKANTMILTHPKHKPHMLRCFEFPSQWGLTDVKMINVPYVKNPKTKEYEEQWSQEYGYPEHSAFLSGRLVFCKSKKYPNMVWVSSSFHSYNFEQDYTTSKQNHNMAIFHDIPKYYIGDIQNIHANEKLMIFSSQGINIQPQNVNLDQDFYTQQYTYQPCMNIKPVSLDLDVFFLSGSRHTPYKTLHRLYFDDEFQTFKAQDMNPLTPEILEKPTKMALQKSYSANDPHRLFVVKEDGTAAVMSFKNNQFAWSYISTQGKIMDCTSVCGEVFFLVKRKVGEKEKIFLEQWLKNRALDASLKNPDNNDETIRTFNALNLLDGQKVQVICDDMDQGEQTIKNNFIPLKRPTLSVEVGYKFPWEIKTMNLYDKESKNTNTPFHQGFYQVIVNVKKAQQFNINGQLVKFQENMPLNFDQPIKPFQGVHYVTLMGQESQNPYKNISISIKGNSCQEFQLLSLGIKKIHPLNQD